MEKKSWTVHNKQRMINFCAETMSPQTVCLHVIIAYIQLWN